MTALTNNIKNWLGTGTRIRIILFALISVALSLLLFGDFWSSLPNLLSPKWVFEQNHAAPWGVLALCLFFLWAKRKTIGSTINKGRKKHTSVSRKVSGLNLLSYEMLIGVVLVAAAVFIPSSIDLLVFRVLLAWLGVFLAVFGWEAAKIPSILLALYGFTIAFPLAIYRFAERPYSQVATLPLKMLLNLLGYPLTVNGQMINIVSAKGDTIPALVSGACAGPATMAVFIALFVLMMMDIPLPPKKAAWLFLIGIIGTWLQSFIRLVILMLTAYYLGENAMWTAHSWSIYVLFPLWYLIFAYIYFQQVGKTRAERKQTHIYTPADTN